MKIDDYIFYFKLSQREFARHIGVHWRYMHGLVNGEYIPSRKLALKIEKLTDGKISAHELLFPRSLGDSRRENVDKKVLKSKSIER